MDFDAEATLAAATSSFSAGDYAAALEHYHQLAEAFPDNPDLAVNLGICLENLGRTEEAQLQFETALSTNPALLAARYNLANSLQRQGELDAAALHYQKLLDDKPDHLGSNINLARLYSRQDQFDQTVPLLLKALEIDSGAGVKIFPLLAKALRRTGNAEVALTLMKPVMESTNSPAMHLEYGRCLLVLGRVDEARSVADAVESEEVLPEGYWLLKGLLHLDAGDANEAVAAYRRALEEQPKSLEAKINLGGVLLDLGEFKESESLLLDACALNPDDASLLNNLGALYMKTGRLDDAERTFRHCIAKNDSPKARTNLGCLLLMQDQFEEGWQQYESRLELESTKEVAPEPNWQGEDLDGKQLLLVGEQGIGDSVQMLRYARVLKERGARVSVICREEIAELINCCDGVADTHSKMGESVTFHYSSMMMSLPRVFNEKLEGSLHQEPYLHIPAPLKEEWQARLAHLKGLRIGINWQGNPNFLNDRWRSVPLALWSPLFELDATCVSWVSLQKGDAGKNQLTSFLYREKLYDPDKDLDRDRSFLDTAAMIDNLDLVITSCTSLAHVAGAMGAPTWVLLDVNADWRWGVSRSDCPWYPRTSLFRQTEFNRWESVFEQVFSALQAELVSSASTGDSRAS